MKVFGIGHAMVDLFCLPSEKAFTFASPLRSNEIIHIPASEMDVLLTSLEAADVEFSALSQKNRVSGGTAANILKAAASLGADCTFYGATGMVNGARDDNSLFFQKELGNYGVKSFLTSENEPTGRFLIVKTADGDFAGAASPSAASKLSLKHVNTSAFTDTDFAVMEGMLCLNKTVFSQVVELCRSFDVMPVIDAASPFAAETAVLTGLELFVKAGLPFILFVNEVEAQMISRCAGEPFENLAKKYGVLHSKTLIIKKLGERGVQAWTDGFFLDVPTQAKTAFDATGAGDVFAGAFLSSYASFSSAESSRRKFVLGQCLSFANKAASVVLDFSGCRFDPAVIRSLT